MIGSTRAAERAGRNEASEAMAKQIEERVKVQTHIPIYLERFEI